jgi:hypothetical protein
MEYLFSSRKPAEFVRIVTALMLNDGKILRGAYIDRDESAVWGDPSGRNETDRLFQASLMRTAINRATVNSPREYTNSAAPDRDKRGLTENEFSVAMEVLFGTGRAVRGGGVFPAVAESLKTSYPIAKLPLIVAIDWYKRYDDGSKGSDGHAWIVEDVKGSDAIVIDLADTGTSVGVTVADPANKLNRADGPKRVSVGDSRFKIPLTELAPLVEFFGSVY